MKLFNIFKDKKVNYENSDILFDFLSGLGKDNKGRSIFDIWAYDDADLEKCHDYIQWIFPLKEKSKYNIFAPVVATGMVRSYAQDDNIRNSLLSSLIMMLDFYGFYLVTDDEDLDFPRIVKADSFQERSSYWMTPGNHNYLRITRILKSLVLFNMRGQALSFYNILKEVYENDNQTGYISFDSFTYWEQAAGVTD